MGVKIRDFFSLDATTPPTTPEKGGGGKEGKANRDRDARHGIMRRGEMWMNIGVQLTLRCDGVKAPEYGSGSGLSSHASARKPPHCPEGKWEAEEQELSEEMKKISRKAIRGRNTVRCVQKCRR